VFFYGIAIGIFLEFFIMKHQLRTRG